MLQLLITHLRENGLLGRRYTFFTIAHKSVWTFDARIEYWERMMNQYEEG